MNKNNNISTNNIYVIDFGGRQKFAQISHNGQPTTTISYKEVFNLPTTLPQNSVLICEYAHLGCPKESSLAQPFSSKELLQLYKNFEQNNIILRLFPHAMTPAALGNYRLKHPDATKSDELDPIIIYEYVLNSNITLQKPPKYFESKKDILYRQITETPKNIHEEYWIRKNNLNTTLNIARKYKYLVEDDKISQFIEDNIDEIYQELIKDFDSKTIQQLFKIKINKKTGKVLAKTNSKKQDNAQWKIKIGLIYTILATLLNPDGKLLLRKNGRFPSVYHIMRYILCCTPNHFRGGTGRSNIFWHGFRNYLREISKNNINLNYKRKIDKGEGKKGKMKSSKVIVGHGNFTQEENEFFTKTRLEYMKVLKKLNYILRKKLMPNLYDENGYTKKKISNNVLVNS